MNLLHTRQAMLKKAYGAPGTYEPGRGFKPDEDYADNTRVYRDAPPGSTGDTASHGWGGFAFHDASQNGFANAGLDKEKVGTTRRFVNYDTRGTTPTVQFNFPKRGEYWEHGPLNQWIRMEPNQTVSHRFGTWLMAPSWRYQQAHPNISGSYEPGREQPFIPDTYRPGQNGRNRIPADWLRKPDAQESIAIENAAAHGNLNLTIQPFTNKELTGMFTGDPGYWDARWAHYKRIPERAWTKGNLQRSSDASAAAAANYVPPLAFNGDGSYNPIDGEINASTDAARDRFRNTWGQAANTGYWSDNGQVSYGTKLSTSATLPGVMGDTYKHELNHLISEGNVALPDWTNWDSHAYLFNPKRWTVPYNPNEPASGRNTPTLFQPIDSNPIFLTQKQLGYVRNNALQPYLMDPNEINQAFVGFNEGRNALKWDMMNNPNKPIYQALEEGAPGAMEKFKALPDFIESGEEGEKQFKEMMQVFQENPALRPLMGEQFRLVDYYQNIKAAVDNATLKEQQATTPEEKAEAAEEKAWLQNIMQEMMYNKAFLADNRRRPVPSYADSYRAYA